MCDLNDIKSANELLIKALSKQNNNQVNTKEETETIKDDFDFSKITSPGFLYLAAEARSRK